MEGKYHFMSELFPADLLFLGSRVNAAFSKFGDQNYFIKC